MEFWDGCTGPSTQQTIGYVEYASKEGADGAIIAAPPYICAPDEDITDYFLEVADASNIPIGIYNNPPRVKTDLAHTSILRLAEMVFPGQTNHYGTLYGGDALKMMGKAAFIAATRHTREVLVMASSDRIDFVAPIREGDMVELVAEVKMTGRSSVRVAGESWSEDRLSGIRVHAATAAFTFVAVNEMGTSKTIRARHEYPRATVVRACDGFGS